MFTVFLSQVVNYYSRILAESQDLLHNGTLWKPIVVLKMLVSCSVTAQEVVNAIERQTGRVIDKRMVNLPEIKTTGTYVASVKLHPDGLGEFKVVVQKEKGASG